MTSKNHSGPGQRKQYIKEMFQLLQRGTDGSEKVCPEIIRLHSYTEKLFCFLCMLSMEDQFLLNSESFCSVFHSHVEYNILLCHSFE